MKRAFPVLLGIAFGLILGCAGGFGLGILSTKGGSAFLASLFATEKPAAIGTPKAFARAAFRFEYPGNWRVDEADEDYDPDHLFSIGSPGSCNVTFVVFDSATSAQDSVDAQVEAFVPKMIRNPAREAFAEWGRFEGVGVKLRGKVLGFQDGWVRIFAHEDEPADLTFTVVEFCYDEDAKHVQPGYDLIERTFALERR